MEDKGTSVTIPEQLNGTVTQVVEKGGGDVEQEAKS